MSAEPAAAAAVADAELVARSRRRDAEAFGALVERHQRLVFGVALARCRDAALAEDVAQEAFVAAWRDLDRLRDGDRVGPWVAGIARNLASSATRTQARRRSEPLDEGGPLAAPALAEVATPRDEAIEREDRELLGRALADVPEAYREVLVLYYLEGESIAAIAAALELREDAVKQRLSRGRRAVRESVAARVETALTRVRHRPALRAGVLAALTTGGAGAREAAAAGKAVAVMSTKHVIAAGVVAAALGGSAIWIGTRASADERGAVAGSASPTEVAVAAAPSGKAAASARLRVRRADRAAQAALRAAIEERARRRAAAPAAPAGSATDAGSARSGTLPTFPRGELAQTYLQAAMREVVPMVSACYDEALVRRPGLAGSVMVELRIEGEPEIGAVIADNQIDPTETDLIDPQVHECIRETMYALQLDPPEEGGSIRIRYKLTFSPDDDDKNDGAGSGAGSQH